MSERPTDPLELYAWLKQQIATLDAELDSLKESVFSSVDATGGIFEKDNYAIRSQKRPKYKFSAAYDAKNDELKALKKTEIDDGIATIESYSEFVTIKFKKPDAD
jgi:mannose/cellobiose epimerase-like protein (N-acyl-D-glucosamine 2-epimerase family)